MKTLLITTALFTAPLVGAVSAQATTSTLTSTLTKLVSEQERQIKELNTEVNSLRSLLDLERRNNGKSANTVSTKLGNKTLSSSHTVKAGDTFSSISRKHGVSVSSLIAANPRVKPSRIAINQKLVIPQANTKATAPAPKAVATSSSTSSKRTTSTSKSTYKVSKGDTLYAIARQHNVTPASLTAANPGINPAKLRIGQTIKLTKNATKSSTKSTSSYKSLPKVAALKKASASAKPKKVAKTTTKPKPAPKTVVKSTKKPSSMLDVGAYVEQSGDVARTVPVSYEMTFGAFAKKHGTTVGVLNALNGLDLPADEPMAAGSELFIPNK